MLSARNQFRGKAVSVKGGSVMAEVVLDIGGGHQIVSLIIASSAKRLKLKKGSHAVAVIKATEVIMPLVFGSLSTALGMWPVFWLDALMLAWGGWLMHRDAGKSSHRSTLTGDSNR